MAPAPAEPAPFPLRAQTEADLDAAEWGLLAWEDPDGDGSGSPFWAEAPALEAIPWPSTPEPVAALGRQPGWDLSGLRLLDGGVVLKVECGASAVQLRIPGPSVPGTGVPGGAGFDPEGGVMVLTPTGLGLPVRLRRAADLWPVAGVVSKRAAGASPTRSS